MGNGEAEVIRLAALARIHVPEVRVPILAREFEQILSYVSQLEQISLPGSDHANEEELKNVFREDGKPHDPGVFTEAITTQFPDKKDDFLKVKKII